jgi:hypothetical protein
LGWKRRNDQPGKQCGPAAMIQGQHVCFSRCLIDALFVKQAQARGVNDLCAEPFIWKNITAAVSLRMSEGVRRVPRVIDTNAHCMPSLAKKG